MIMSDAEFEMPTPDPALRRLDFLVGRWELSGTTEAGPMGPAATLRGTETFEWLEGGFFLVHHWQGVFDMGEQQMTDTGYEFFDYDPEKPAYRTRFFNNFGPYDETGSTYVGDFDGDALVVTGPARVTRRPDPDGGISYDGDMPDGQGGWIPWMHAKLTRLD